MRIAVLADIHGNLPAFEAAINAAKQLRVDRFVIAGDVVNGSPDSAGCWQLAQNLHCPILRGNHERYVMDFGTERSDPLWETERFAPLHWSVNQFSDVERVAMRSLPLTFQFSDIPEVLFVHASARNDVDAILAYTPEADLNAMFPQVTEKWIIRGHNHNGQCRLWDDRVIVTAGSVGLPLDGHPTAQFAVLEKGSANWKVHHHSVPYDLDRLAKRFYESGYLDVAGGMARIFFREVMTGGHQIVPFLRALNSWDDPSLPIHQAVDRFFSMY